MIDVFVEYSNQGGQRTFIPGGPFPNWQIAHLELANYATLQAGGWPHLLVLIDSYGFVVDNAGVVRVQAKP